MAFPQVGPQSLYLYPANWDDTKDKLILACLIEKIEECNPTPPHLSTHALIYAMMALNSQLQAGVSLNEFESRVDFLHDRYVCFKHLCNLQETQWDRTTNVLHADDQVWQELFKENAFFRAYYHNGDPEYLQMCNLFGLYDIKKELSHTVIVIEDSSTVKKPSLHNINGEYWSEDEVTSPILKPKPVAKPVAARNIFPDDACSSAATSFHNALQNKLDIPWNALKNKLRRPTKSKDDRNCDGGYGASSCASSSPFK